MRGAFFVGLFILVSGAVAAKTPDWIELSSTDESIWEGRAASREFSKTRGGKEIVVATGRVVDKKTKQIAFEKWYVTVEHCNAGFGKLVTLKMDGSFNFETDFVEKGGTVASTLAAVLCSAVKERDEKGI